MNNKQSGWLCVGGPKDGLTIDMNQEETGEYIKECYLVGLATIYFFRWDQILSTKAIELLLENYRPVEKDVDNACIR